jgi:hypothetical protein
VVFVNEKADCALLAHINISKRINESFSGVKNLVKINHVKIWVELSTAVAVNGVLKAKFLKIYRVYIAAESVELDGVDIMERDFNLDDLKESGSGKFSHPLVPEAKIVDA